MDSSRSRRNSLQEVITQAPLRKAERESITLVKRLLLGVGRLDSATELQKIYRHHERKKQYDAEEKRQKEEVARSAFEVMNTPRGQKTESPASSRDSKRSATRLSLGMPPSVSRKRGSRRPISPRSTVQDLGEKSVSQRQSRAPGALGQEENLLTVAPRVLGNGVIDGTNSALVDLGDLAKLPPWPRTTTLFLRNNILSDQYLSPLCSLKELHVLDLSNNALEYPPKAAFERLDNLTILNISRNRLHSLSFLPVLGKLVCLSAFSNSIVKVDCPTMPSLAQLQLQRNKIESTIGIHCQPSLEEIYLEGNPIVDDITESGPLRKLEVLFWLLFAFGDGSGEAGKGMLRKLDELTFASSESLSRVIARAEREDLTALFALLSSPVPVLRAAIRFAGFDVIQFSKKRPFDAHELFCVARSAVFVHSKSGVDAVDTVPKVAAVLSRGNPSRSAGIPYAPLGLTSERDFEWQRIRAVAEKRKDKQEAAKKLRAIARDVAATETRERMAGVPQQVHLQEEAFSELMESREKAKQQEEDNIEAMLFGLESENDNETQRTPSLVLSAINMESDKELDGVDDQDEISRVQEDGFNDHVLAFSWEGEEESFVEQKGASPSEALGDSRTHIEDWLTTSSAYRWFALVEGGEKEEDLGCDLPFFVPKRDQEGSVIGVDIRFGPYMLRVLAGTVQPPAESLSKIAIKGETKEGEIVEAAIVYQSGREPRGKVFWLSFDDASHDAITRETVLRAVKGDIDVGDTDVSFPTILQQDNFSPASSISTLRLSYEAVGKKLGLAFISVDADGMEEDFYYTVADRIIEGKAPTVLSVRARSSSGELFSDSHGPQEGATVVVEVEAEGDTRGTEINWSLRQDVANDEVGREGTDGVVSLEAEDIGKRLVFDVAVKNVTGLLGYRGSLDCGVVRAGQPHIDFLSVAVTRAGEIVGDVMLSADDVAAIKRRSESDGAPNDRRATAGLIEGDVVEVDYRYRGGKEGASRVTFCASSPGQGGETILASFVRSVNADGVVWEEQANEDSIIENRNPSCSKLLCRLSRQSVGSLVLVKITPVREDGVVGGSITRAVIMETLREGEVERKAARCSYFVQPASPSVVWAKLSSHFAVGDRVLLSYGYEGGLEGESLYEVWSLVPDAEGSEVSECVVGDQKLANIRLLSEHGGETDASAISNILSGADLATRLSAKLLHQGSCTEAAGAEYELRAEDEGSLVLFILTPFRVDGLKGSSIAVLLSTPVSTDRMVFDALDLPERVVEGEEIKVDFKIATTAVQRVEVRLVEGTEDEEEMLVETTKTAGIDTTATIASGSWERTDVAEAASTEGFRSCSLKVPYGHSGKSVLVLLYPMNQDGKLAGDPVSKLLCSSIEAALPEIYSVKITGTLKMYCSISASFAYRGGVQKAVEVQWYGHPRGIDEVPEGVTEGNLVEAWLPSTQKGWVSIGTEDAFKPAEHQIAWAIVAVAQPVRADDIRGKSVGVFVGCVRDDIPVVTVVPKYAMPTQRGPTEGEEVELDVLFSGNENLSCEYAETPPQSPSVVPRHLLRESLALRTRWCCHRLPDASEGRDTEREAAQTEELANFEVSLNEEEGIVVGYKVPMGTFGKELIVEYAIVRQSTGFTGPVSSISVGSVEPAAPAAQRLRVIVIDASLQEEQREIELTSSANDDVQARRLQVSTPLWAKYDYCGGIEGQSEIIWQKKSIDSDNWETVGSTNHLVFDDKLFGYSLRFHLRAGRSDGQFSGRITSPSTPILWPPGPADLYLKNVQLFLEDTEIIREPIDDSKLAVGALLDLASVEDIEEGVGWETIWFSTTKPTKAVPKDVPKNVITLFREEQEKGEAIEAARENDWEQLVDATDSFSLPITDDFTGKRIACLIIPVLPVNEHFIRSKGVWIELIVPFRTVEKEPFSAIVRLFCDNQAVNDDAVPLVSSTLEAKVDVKGFSVDQIKSIDIQWDVQDAEEGRSSSWLTLQGEKERDLPLGLSFFGKLIRVNATVTRDVEVAGPDDSGPPVITVSASTHHPVATSKECQDEVVALLQTGINGIAVMFVDEEDMMFSAELSADGSKLTLRHEDDKAKFFKCSIDKTFMIEEVEAVMDGIEGRVYGFLLTSKGKQRGQLLLHSRPQRDAIFLALDEMRRRKALGSKKASKRWKALGNGLRAIS